MGWSRRGAAFRREEPWRSCFLSCWRKSSVPGDEVLEGHAYPPDSREVATDLSLFYHPARRKNFLKGLCSDALYTSTGSNSQSGDKIRTLCTLSRPGTLRVFKPERCFLLVVKVVPACAGASAGPPGSQTPAKSLGSRDGTTVLKLRVQMGMRVCYLGAPLWVFTFHKYFCGQSPALREEREPGEEGGRRPPPRAVRVTGWFLDVGQGS